MLHVQATRLSFMTMVISLSSDKLFSWQHSMKVRKFFLCVWQLGILVTAMQTIGKISVYKHWFSYSNVPSTGNKRPFVLTTNEALVGTLMTIGQNCQ